jgi:hypothetical protein
VNDDLISKRFPARAGNDSKIRRIRITHTPYYRSPPVPAIVRISGCGY